MPTIWELPNPLPGQTLNQVWFVGGHTDVGGSYDDTRAADITLAWMISQLEKVGLKFSEEVMKKQFYRPEGEEPQTPWSCGPIHNSYKGLYLLADSLTRSPSAYVRYDHYTGVPKVPREELVNTHEKVHSSVRMRWGLRGKDYEGKDYASPALKGWTVQGLPKNGVANGANGASSIDVQSIRDGQAGIFWKNGSKIMREEEISDLEWQLLSNYRPDIGSRFLSINPGH